MGEKQEFEGWWEPVESSPSPKLSGKAELDRWGEERVAANFLARKLDLPDGEVVHVFCEGREVLSATVSGGKAQARLDSDEGDEVPDLSDRAVELRHGDTVLARTVVVPE